jgi:hypothetical protein
MDNMTKSQLIKWSGIRDFLDIIVIGQIPGINWLLDLPVLIMHLNYAGPVALFTLLEAIPGLGFLPIWTIAAMSYPNHDEACHAAHSGMPQRFTHHESMQYLPSTHTVRRAESQVLEDLERE